MNQLRVVTIIRGRLSATFNGPTIFPPKGAGVIDVPSFNRCLTPTERETVQLEWKHSYDEEGVREIDTRNFKSQ